MLFIKCKMVKKSNFQNEINKKNKTKQKKNVFGDNVN